MSNLIDRPLVGQRVIGRYLGTPFAGVLVASTHHTIAAGVTHYTVVSDADIDVPQVRVLPAGVQFWMTVGYESERADGLSIFADGLLDPQSCDHCSAEVEVGQRVLYKEHGIRGWVLCSACHALDL